MLSTFQRLHPFMRIGMRLLMRLLAPRWRVTGRQNLPYRSPMILAPNHISDADPPLIATSMRYPIWFMAKQDLWDIGWLSKVCDFCQAFPVDPATPDRSALKFSADLLARGETLVVFPEGKISETGELCEILPGVVMLALRSGVPVIPVGIYGAEKLIPYGDTKPHFTLDTVRIHFGKPLDFSDLKALPAREARQKAAQRLEAGIRQAMRIAAGEGKTSGQ